MRITFVLPFAGLNGGIRVVAIHAERLRKRGHQVVVISTPKPPTPLRAKARALVKTGRIPTEPRQTHTYFDGLDVEHRVIDRWRPVTDSDAPDADVVVATWWETAEWVAALSPAKGAKAYFVQHYEVHAWQPVERVRATWRLPMHKIVIARWLADLARDRFGDGDTSLVPNSVDTSQFFASARGKQAHPTVGLMYSTAPFKGCDVSLRAVALASERVADLRLVAFGSERPTPELPLPPGAAYTCQPAQGSIREIYASCDAWLFGSRSEGFGLPLLEAMACRTPVIATPAGAAPELLASGGGVMAPEDDAEAMARAIELFASMPNEAWKAMSAAALRTATSFTWDDAAALFERGLQRAVERAARGEIAGGSRARMSA